MSIQAIKFLDKYIGSIACFLLGLFSRKRAQIARQYPKILIIQLWGIGETALTLPAIRALRNKYKSSKITALTTKRNCAVYENSKDINKMVILSMNPVSIFLFIISNFRKFNLVVDFEEYLNISAIISFFTGRERLGFIQLTRSKLYTKTRYYNDKQHTTQTFLDLVRVLGCDYKFSRLIRLDTTDKERKPIREFLKENNITDKNLVVGITAGAAESSRSRIWPLARYAELADKLVERYGRKRRKPVILFIGADYDKRIIKEIMSRMKHKKRVIDCSGNFTLRQTFYLIDKCGLYISNDTGPMHIAAAQGVPTVGLFGPNMPIRWAPFGKNKLGKENISIYHKQFCSPCIHTHHGIVPECIFGKDNKCMKAIRVEEVMSGVDRLLR